MGMPDFVIHVSRPAASSGNSRHAEISQTVCHPFVSADGGSKCRTKHGSGDRRNQPAGNTFHGGTCGKLGAYPIGKQTIRSNVTSGGDSVDDFGITLSLGQCIKFGLARGFGGGGTHRFV